MIVAISAAAGFWAFQAQARAGQVGWTFDDPGGTTLDQAESAAAATWSGNFETSGTTGDGAYRLTRGAGTTANAFAALDVDPDADVTVSYVLRSWNLRGRTVSETLRLGFVDKPHESRPHVLCQFKLERTAADELTVGVEAFGEGSGDVAETITLDAASDELLTLMLEYDASADRYDAFYALGDREPTRLGGADTSPERGPKFLRIGATGSINATGEEVLIESVTVSQPTD